MADFSLLDGLTKGGGDHLLAHHFLKGLAAVLAIKGLIH